MTWLVKKEVYNTNDELCFIIYYDRSGSFRNCEYHNNYELKFPKKNYIKCVYSNGFEDYFINGLGVSKKQLEEYK